MKLSSIRTRLTLWSTAVQALIMAVMGFTLWTTVRISLLSSVDRELRGRATGIASRRNPFGFPRFGRMFPRRDQRPGDSPPFSARPNPSNSAFIRFRPRLLDLNGKPLIPEATEGPWDPNALHNAVQGRETFTTIRTQGESVRVLSMPLRRDNGIIGVLQVAYSLEEVDRDLGGLTRALLMLIPVALLVTGLSGALQTDRMLHPVRKITQAAARIGAADLSERLPVVGEDELSDLTRTFNGMLARLERGFEQQSRFTADASHELRTPLTAIKAHTSLALSGDKTKEEYVRALEGANRAATVMTQIIQDLLFLARLESDKQNMALVPVPLREIFDLSLELMAECEHPPIALDERTPNARVLGDASQLVRLFTNLLNNAVRHTPLTGRITLRSHVEADTLYVDVIDTGTGIAPEHLPHVCERFYRVDAARSRKQGGTGLGLAISRTIVEGHGGQLTLESVLGQGTTVHITLVAVP